MRVAELTNIDPAIKEKLFLESRKSPNKYKHAAALFDSKNQLICVSFNRFNQHAEWKVWTKYCQAYRPRGRKAAYMVSMAFTKAGRSRIARPCGKCLSFFDSIDMTCFYSVSECMK